MILKKKSVSAKTEKTAGKSLSQPWCSHSNTIYDAQLQKTIALCTQPQHQATLTQPLQCALQWLSCKTQQDYEQQRQQNLAPKACQPGFAPKQLFSNRPRREINCGPEGHQTAKIWLQKVPGQTRWVKSWLQKAPGPTRRANSPICLLGSSTRFGDDKSRSHCTCCSRSTSPWTRTTESSRHRSSHPRCRSTYQCATDRWDGYGHLQPTQYRQTNTTEAGISFEWPSVSIDFCKSSRLAARSEKHTHEHHDTPWKNIRSIPFDRTQRFISWDALHKQNRGWQSHGSAICYWAEKIFPASGRRRNWWNRRPLGRRWRRWRRRTPGCSRRCFLDLSWRSLRMVSEKVPRQTDQKRKRKRKETRKRQMPRRKKILQTKKGKEEGKGRRKRKKERPLSHGEWRRIWRRLEWDMEWWLLDL